MPFTSVLGKNYISPTWDTDARENGIFVNPASYRAGYCKVNNNLPLQALLSISKQIVFSTQLLEINLRRDFQVLPMFETIICDTVLRELLVQAQHN